MDMIVFCRFSEGELLPLPHPGLGWASSTVPPPTPPVPVMELPVPPAFTPPADVIAPPSPVLVAPPCAPASEPPWPELPPPAMPVLLTEALELVTPCPVVLTETLPSPPVEDTALLLEVALEPSTPVALADVPLVVVAVDSCWYGASGSELHPRLQHNRTRSRGEARRIMPGSRPACRRRPRCRWRPWHGSAW